MAYDTNHKLNETLEKMGVMAPAHSSNSGSIKQSSDKSFYLIMIAMVVGMGFYISYDMDQRYGASSGSTPANNEVSEPQAKAAPATPVVVGIEKAKSVEIKPVAEVPATETTPEAVVVKKVEQDTTVTTAVVPVAAPEAQKVAVPAPAAESQAVMAAPEVVSPAAPAVEPQPGTASEVVAAPVVEETPVSTETAAVAEAQTPAAEQAQDYNPYGYPYGYQYQRNYYQQQPYRNPYYYQNRNPYGYNPYQRPAAAPAE